MRGVPEAASAVWTRWHAAVGGAAGPRDSRSLVRGRRDLRPRRRCRPLLLLQAAAAATLQTAEGAPLELPLAVARLIARPALQLVVLELRQ